MDLDREEYELALSQARLELGVIAFDWDPDLHPRDLFGQFKKAVASAADSAARDRRTFNTVNKVGDATSRVVDAKNEIATQARMLRENRRERKNSVDTPDGVSVIPDDHGFIVDGNGEAVRVDSIEKATDEALDRSKATGYKSMVKKVARNIAAPLSEVLRQELRSRARNKIGGPSLQSHQQEMVNAAIDAIGAGFVKRGDKHNVAKQLGTMLGRIVKSNREFGEAQAQREIADWLIDKLVDGGMKRLNAAQFAIADLELSMEPGYERDLAIARVESGLYLATKFDTGPGGAFDPILVPGAKPGSGGARYRRQRQREGKNPTGTGEFDESKVSRASEGTAEGGQFISKGDSGTAVQRIQAEIGVDPSGEFNSRTEAALRKYQRENGLTVDGLVGSETAASLLGKSERDPGELGTNQIHALQSTAALQRAISAAGQAEGDKKANKSGGGAKAVKRAVKKSGTTKTKA